MIGSRVLVLDDNQSFSALVVAAFAEAGIQAETASRGQQALHAISLVQPDLVVVDLVRPSSEGQWLIEQLQGARGRAGGPAILALVPVIGGYSGLPDGVEILVKPIFPGQVVASARRLLGPSSQTPSSIPPLSGQSPARKVAEHNVPAAPLAPASGAPTPTSAAPPPRDALDSFDDDSDFGPGETLLAPTRVRELARNMTSIVDESLPTSGYDSDSVTIEILDPDATQTDTGDETTTPRLLATAPLSAATASSLSSAAASLAARAEEPMQAERSRPATKRGLHALPTSGSAVILPSGQRVALTGDLSCVFLIDVVGLLARQQQTGMLTVSAPGRTIELVLNAGRTELCTASGFPELRLGRFVSELFHLRPEQLDQIAAQASVSPTGNSPMDLLGMRLCRAGMLRHDELRRSLGRQTAELLYEALRMTGGRFTFTQTRELPRTAADPEFGGALSLDTEALLLEGYRRLDDWLIIERDAEEGAIYVQSAELEVASRVGLSDSEATVFGLCNGRLSLREIAEQSRLPILDVARALQRMQTMRLCRRRLPAALAG